MRASHHAKISDSIQTADFGPSMTWRGKVPAAMRRYSSDVERVVRALTSASLINRRGCSLTGAAACSGCLRMGWVARAMLCDLSGGVVNMAAVCGATLPGARETKSGNDYPCPNSLFMAVESACALGVFGWFARPAAGPLKCLKCFVFRAVTLRAAIGKLLDSGA